ncbi:hypothetical protein L218DRAFT_946803 [Marasmius fiardii PR-910]|nr:hypothetical protein L218DRAFT_946803 [Marasmius fiardii PR-910]
MINVEGHAPGFEWSHGKEKILNTQNVATSSRYVSRRPSLHIQDPPRRNIRGRPRTARLTNLEGRGHTGGKRKATAATGMTARAPRKCSRCHKPGHTHPNCTEDTDQGEYELDGDQYE